MENLLDIKLLSAPSLLLSFIRETKYKTTKTLIIFRIVCCSMLTLTVTSIFINLFSTQGEAFLETLQSFMHAFHTLVKYVFFIIYKLDIFLVLNCIKYKFWDYTKFKQVKKSVETMHTIISTMQKAMLVVSFFLAWGYLIISVFASSNDFPFLSYTPKSAAASAVLWLCHVHTFYMGDTIVIGYDLMYFSLCAHIVVQVRLLKAKVTDILNKPHSKIMVELKACIEYHQFLFGLFLRMKRIYSVMLLVQYFLTLITSCSVLFEVVSGNGGLGNHIVKSVAVLFFLGEFAFYALPAEQVSFEFSDLSGSIYSSKWYVNTVDVQKLMLFLMLKTQQIHYFSATGFIDINVDAFGSVARKAFSFCTILRNLLNK